MKKILFVLALAPFAVNAQDHHDGPHKDMHHPAPTHHRRHRAAHHNAPVHHGNDHQGNNDHQNDHRNDGHK